MLSSFETLKAKKKKESVNISHMRTSFCKNSPALHLEKYKLNKGFST